MVYSATDFITFMTKCHTSSVSSHSLQLGEKSSQSPLSFHSSSTSDLSSIHNFTIDLCGDNINSIFVIIDTYNLNDENITRFICFCIDHGINCDVVITENFWSVKRMNETFYGKNFISMVGILYSMKRYNNLIQDIYLKLMPVHTFSNSNLQQFVMETVKSKNILQSDKRIRCKHILSFFNDSKDIHSHITPLFVKLNIPHTHLESTLDEIRMNKVFISMMTHLTAVSRGRGKHHSVLCNVNLLHIIMEYCGSNVKLF